MDISVIIPVYNEYSNLEPVSEELLGVLENTGRSFEIVFVDDGSTDGTTEALQNLNDRAKAIKVITLRRNYGQTAAMMAGIKYSSGDILIGMDGDGQNDPADIPHLLAKLDQGFDVVSGWRKDRKDKFLTRRLPSMAANWMISAVSGIRLHDYGCSLKAYRRQCIEGVRLYGEMHRFIPIYSAWEGGKITEIEVNHRPRTRGTSKYGLNRIFKVALDLILLQLLERFMTKPIHLFGGFSLICFALSGGTGLWATWLKIFEGTSFISTPLPLIVIMCGGVGILSLLLGFLAEIVVRTYFESQGKDTFLVVDNRDKPRQ